MKQQIENIIKKNLPEKLREEFYKENIPDYKDGNILMKNIADWWLSKIPVSLIADEVLKVVVEKIEEIKKNRNLANDFMGNPNEWQISILNYNRALEDIIKLLSNSSTLEGEQSEHLSPNNENEEYNYSSVKIDPPKPPFTGLHYQG